MCKVDKQLKPYCECHGNCVREDLYTGTLCGRDGKEYKNLCALKKRNCGHAETDQITVKKYGKCQDSCKYRLKHDISTYRWEKIPET